MAVKNIITGSFPQTRPRRNRQNEWSRRLVAETSVLVDDLILPVFIKEGKNIVEEVPSMPGVSRFSIDTLIDHIKQSSDLGIPAIAIFPAIDNELKSEDGRESYNSDNLVCRAIKEVKDAVPDIGIICDVALDPYTSHGHDGLLKDGIILNDETLEILCSQAIAQAKAGCDIIAPSDMMDGRVGAIRKALDDEGFSSVRIMSYAAKYASSFYGPFRDAIGSASNLLKGSKKSYQMDPKNSDEAALEVALDIKEGADMVIVKPGMPYLDIISKIKEHFRVPVFAYQVSGEYAMMKAASENNWLDFDQVMYESLISFKRAGASGVLTYSAIDIAKLLND